VAAAGLALDGAVSVWRGRRSLRWPTTQGRIAASKVRPLLSGQSVLGAYFTPGVRYEYEVDHRVYYSNRISYGGWWSAWDVVDSHPVGTSWAVSYDPDDPATAVLDPGVKTVSVVELCLGLGLATGGILFSLGVLSPPSGTTTPTSPPM
jgi:hypothetical protein